MRLPLRRPRTRTGPKSYHCFIILKFLFWGGRGLRRNINCCLPYTVRPEIEPSTKVRVLTGNRTGDLSVSRMLLQPSARVRNHCFKSGLHCFHSVRWPFYVYGYTAGWSTVWLPNQNYQLSSRSVCQAWVYVACTQWKHANLPWSTRKGSRNQWIKANLPENGSLLINILWCKNSKTKRRRLVKWTR